jgi:hypothetical protein
MRQKEIPMKNNLTATAVRARILYSVLAVMTSIFCIGEKTMAQNSPMTHVKNVVLVHGGFVDGSGWQSVYNALKKNGYEVTIVQNSTTSLADDVATTKRALATLNGARDSRRSLIWWRSDHRSGNRSEGSRIGVHRRLCPGQGRIGGIADQGFPGWRAPAADSPTSRRVPHARQGEVSCVVRRRCKPGGSSLHG